jgi:peptidyl-prolyl cis-trans isomerase A (cyclophilin A)
MRLLFTTLLSVAAALAQTPAHKTGAAPKAATKSAPQPNPLLSPSTLTRRAPAEFQVKFATTAGDFTVAVHRDWAPLGADRFYNLVRNHFFNGETFFRVVPNFIVQFGLSGDPAINKAWENATIKDDPFKQHNTRGTVVFANAGPNTRATQFFINLRDNSSSLDAPVQIGFTPFGVVTEGMENVDKIFPGYGESPSQDAITNRGDAYLKKSFPNLTRITSTTLIVPAATPAPAAKKAAAPAAKAPAKKQ